MSGFTRDTKHYGDRLVYEALDSKWRGYHARCRCGGHWSDHLEPAGFTVARQGNGFVALTGPGLTEEVNEAALTTNALWEAVTGQSGAQTWFDTVQVIDRSEKAEAKRKADNDRYYKELRARSEANKKAAKKQPPTPAQCRYLTFLTSQLDVEHFDVELAKALKGTRIAKRKRGEEPAKVIDRLTKDTAHTLISLLKSRQDSATSQPQEPVADDVHDT